MSGINTSSLLNWNNNAAQGLFAGFQDAVARFSNQPEKVAAATQTFNQYDAMYRGINGVVAQYTKSEFEKATEWKGIRV
jgi:hypothetical protein